MLNEFGRLLRVAVKHPRDAFASDACLAAEWQAHGFTAAPDFGLACRQVRRLSRGAHHTRRRTDLLPADGATTIDSIYARDASLATPAGVVLGAMGKRPRAGEPAAQARAFAARAEPSARVIGAIQPPGLIEGGDVVWFDERTVAVGRGYRTNAEGIRQFAAILGDAVTVLEVPLPHWRGPGDVMHLMSLISPLDADLAVATHGCSRCRSASAWSSAASRSSRRRTTSSTRWAPTCWRWRHAAV